MHQKLGGEFFDERPAAHLSGKQGDRGGKTSTTPSQAPVGARVLRFHGEEVKRETSIPSSIVSSSSVLLPGTKQLSNLCEQKRVSSIQLSHKVPPKETLPQEVVQILEAKYPTFFSPTPLLQQCQDVSQVQEDEVLEALELESPQASDEESEPDFEDEDIEEDELPTSRPTSPPPSPSEK